VRSYRESDCFVLASFAEGVPVVLMEAMAMEIPCVTEVAWPIF
jgi:colanic acid/amylovoran biosynthesis glycosyltransferase